MKRTNAAQKLSAASKRALAYTRGPEWFCQFREFNLQGDLQYEEGVIRRDASAVLPIGDTYYVWYTRGTGETGLSLGPDRCLVRDLQGRLDLGGARAGRRQGAGGSV